MTVGTHEQPFDRLVKAIDNLVADGTITEPVFIQTGYCTYEPRHCEHSQWVPYGKMSEMMGGADVVITHGGPSSFIEAMAVGKVPVVVPRKAELGEHVNDHQCDFVRAVAERQGGIIPCYDINELADAIERARVASTGASFASHNVEFCDGMRKVIEGL